MNTNLKRVIVSAVATGALFVNAAIPAFAGSTLVISGNGSDSDNTITTEFSQSTTVVQSNNADVFNSVNASADTGGNDANDNTGGDVEVDTGDATVDVSVSNTLNSNTADIDCCQQGGVDAEISGNGSDSDNDIEVKAKDSGTEVFQTNEADVKNLVWADADTGDNDAKDNTGGDVSVETGDASATVDLSTEANANWARVGGGSEGSGLSARILGNGSDSDNDIKLELGGGVLLVQSNEADVFNKVNADADTGDNDAEDNTGGETGIDTGDATVDVSIDNMVNFNWADVDCGCLFGDLLAKISGNGTDSDNEIKVKLGGGLEVFQDNCADELPHEEGGNHHGHDCDLDNLVWADADTGDNDAEDNTGQPGGDPTVETGDAESDVTVENGGNSNVYGAAPEWDWEIPGLHFNLNLSFSLSDLLAALLG